MQNKLILISEKQNIILDKIKLNYGESSRESENNNNKKFSR